MPKGPNFGERQARRYKERHGHDRAALHSYRPHKFALNFKKPKAFGAEETARGQRRMHSFRRAIRYLEADGVSAMPYEREREMRTATGHRYVTT